MTTNKTTKKQPKKGRVNRDVFVAEYIKTGNSAAAYAKACSNKNMSSESARVSGSRLLTNATVSQQIENARKTVAQECKIDLDWFINECKDKYQLCTQTYQDDRGNEKLVDGATGKSFLEMLGKAIGAFEKDNAQKSELTHTLKAEGMDGWAQIFPTITNNLSLTHKES